MSGDITFSGLGSGTDLGSVVEKLVEIERAQSYRLEAWKSTWEAKIESIQGLNSRLLSLELFVNDFKSASQFLATTASSSSQTVLSVSSTSTAKPGSHSIIVGSSIPHMLASQGWADQNTMGIGDDGGDFVISVGDKGTITIDSGDFDAATTLQGLRDLINSDVENTGDVAVTASILDDGSDTNPYRLVITADNGGEDYEISITANPTDLTYAANWINPVVNSGGWSGTSQATSSGYYLGSDNKTYTFTAPTVTLDGANAATQVTWTKTGGGSGSIVIPDNYVAGTNIFVDGLVDDAIHLSTWSGSARATSGGNYTGSHDKSYTFTVPDGTTGTGDITVNWSESATGRDGTITIPNGYAGADINVDGINSVEHDSGWTGTSLATSSGNYTDTTNQEYSFTVQTVNGGAGTGDVGTDTIVVHWQNTDNSSSGDITLDGTYTPGTAVSVENGLEVSFSSGTLTTAAGNDFTIETEQGPSVSFSTGQTLVNGDTFSIDARTGLEVSFSSGTLVNTEQFYVNTFTNVDTLETDTWSSPTAEVTSVTTVADVGGSLDGTYFYINDPTTEYYVWFDLGDSGTPDPSVPGKTGIEVNTIANDATAEQIASAIASAVDAMADFSATSTGDALTITNANTGYATDAADSTGAPTGFTISPTTQGYSMASVSSSGHYLGATNKTIQFSVLNNGTLGSDELGIQWSDAEGNSGVITIPDDYTPGTNISVFQGIKISFSAGNLVSGDDFSIDVYAPDIQKAQNTGLAQVEQAVHSGFTDQGTTAVTDTNQTFSYTYHGTIVNLSVSSGTTLSGLVNLINSDSDNPGVTASILDDGLGLSTSYHLVLTGDDTGAANAITNIRDTFTGGSFSSSGFTTTQHAQNSMLKVDGYPLDASQFIQRQSNSVSDVIEGITLTLASSGSATVTIAEDVGTIKGTIDTFVASVNFVLDYISDQTKYDADTGEAAIMIGNYSFQIVAQRIKDLLTDSVPGLIDGTDPYVHLAQIGINSDPDDNGRWTINYSTLNSAMSTDLNAVSRLFVEDEASGTDGVLALLSQELEDLNDTETGAMNALIDSYEGIISNIDVKLEREARRIDLVEKRLTRQFAALEVLLGQLSGQSTYLESLIDQLPKIGSSSKQ